MSHKQLSIEKNNNLGQESRVQYTSVCTTSGSDYQSDELLLKALSSLVRKANEACTLGTSVCYGEDGNLRRSHWTGGNTTFSSSHN